MDKKSKPRKQSWGAVKNIDILSRLKYKNINNSKEEMERAIAQKAEMPFSEI